MPDNDSGLSRRTMLKGAAGVGAAGLAASALASVALPAAAATKAATKAQLDTTRGQAPDARADEAIVVHVRNAASGEIDVFRGTTEIRLHDRDLAARLVRASR
jgi:nitrous oxide reductase